MIGRFKDKAIVWVIGYFIVKTGFNTFYKKHQATGVENIPYGDKPIIFASNHQNAFLDPILITIVGPIETYYLTRADIFAKPFLNKLFRSIYMLPIFRQRDGGDPKERNEATFNECYDLLNDNKAIIIFPEGNHTGKKNLRIIKKGLVRIGYGADDKYNGDLDVQIIPVGLNYSSYAGFQSEFLINFGKPISLNDYQKQREEHENRAITTITSKIKEGMKKVMIDIKLDHYEAVNEMLSIFPNEIDHLSNQKSETLSDKFKAQKVFIDKIESAIESKPELGESIDEKVENLIGFTKENKLKYWLFEKENYSFSSILFTILGLIIGLPFHIYGVINNYIPYKMPVWFVDSKIKDVTFHGSFKMALGVVFFKLFWFIQIIIVTLLTDYYIWILYAISLPLSALFSWNYWRTILKTKGKISYNKLNNTNKMKEIKEKRAYLANIIKSL